MATLAQLSLGSKECSKCGELKPLTDFYVKAAMKDGHRSSCKICDRAATRRWRDENREQARAYSKRWAAENRELHAEMTRDWRERNPERVRATARARQQTERGRAYRRDYNLRKKYGISREQYEEMEQRQEGRCAICQKPSPLVVDHNHETGEVRELLCGHCNRGIGCFGDDPGVFLGALAYLEKWGSR